jgi:hypothetical protein
MTLESVSNAHAMSLRDTPAFPVDVPRTNATDLLQEALGTLFVTENCAMSNWLPKTIAARAMNALDLKAVHALDVYFDYLKVSHLFAPGWFALFATET